MDDARMLAALEATRDGLNEHTWIRGEFFVRSYETDDDGFAELNGPIVCACVMGHIGLNAGYPADVIEDVGNTDDEIDTELNAIAAYLIPFAEQIAPVPTGVNGHIFCPWERIAGWNDSSDRGVEGVQQMLDAAIANLKTKMAVTAA